jgi:3-hydroxypropanoate dehydrogenase
VTDLLNAAAPAPAAAAPAAAASTSAAAAPAATPSTGTRLADDALAALFTDARTARTFADTPVSDEQLAGIWELARWAPTSSNLQPLRVVFVQSPEARERLVSHMADGNKARIASAPAVALLAVDTRFHEHVPTVLPTRPEMEQTLAGNDTMRAYLGDFNSAMQAGYFVLATRAQGLAAGPMGGFDKAATDADFFPDGRLRSILVVAIGHPGANPWHDRQPRLDPAEAVAWA